MEKGFNETGLKGWIPDECRGSFREGDGAEVSDDDGSTRALLCLACERRINFDAIDVWTVRLCEGRNMQEVAGPGRGVDHDVAGREVSEIVFVQEFADPGGGKPLMKGDLMEGGWFSMVVMHGYFIYGGVSVEPGTMARVTRIPSALT